MTPTDKPLRLGLIGCGGIVQRAHLPSFQAVSDLVHVATIADVAPDNLAAVGESTGVAPDQRYTDYRAMLEHADLDAVSIATPHHLHVEQVTQAAQAGVAIICEKPMATSLEQADQLLETVAQHGVPYTVVHNFLFAPPMRKALDLLQNSGWTEPQFGRAQSLFNKTNLSDADWRNSDVAGGGCLNDTCYHEIYLLEAMMGSPVRYVEARVQTRLSSLPVDDLSLLLFEHANGSVSTVATSWRVPVMENGNWCEVYTMEHGLRVTGRQRSLHHHDRAKGNWQEVPLPQMELASAAEKGYIGHKGFFAATLQRFAETGEFPVAATQARHNLAIIDAARRATCERRAIEVEAP